MAGSAKEGEKVAAAWLSNQAVIYTILGVVGVVALLVFIHYARQWFSALVDKILAWFQSFVPKPSSQNSDQRPVYDAVTGLAYANQGDRALSDDVDAVKAFLPGSGVTFGTAWDNFFGFGGIKTDTAPPTV